VLEAVGERAQQVRVDLPEEPTLDEAWAEPAAFGGCSTEGQAKPGQPQPIQIVRRKELVQ
jgi:nitrate reductase molybdenum cofactor assembly chaperone NarJ/NarW